MTYTFATEAFEIRRPYTISTRQITRTRAPSELEQRIEGPTNPMLPVTPIANNSETNRYAKPLTTEAEAIQYAKRVADGILSEGRYNTKRLKF